MKTFASSIILVAALTATCFATATAQEKASTPAVTDTVTTVPAKPLPAEIADLVKEANEYCSRSYLEMEQSALEKLKMQLSDLDYPEALAARDKVSETLSLWHEIDGYKRLLYVPFQYGKIQSARMRIYEMQDEMTPAQYDEIYEQLDSPLSRYFHGVKFFQEVLLTQFNQQVDADRKEKKFDKVRSTFTNLLKDPEVKENIEKRIMAVPWLKKKFEDYYTYIMNRRSSPRGPVYQDVMKISLTPGE